MLKNTGLCALAMAALLAACGGDGDPSVGVVQPPPGAAPAAVQVSDGFAAPTATTTVTLDGVAYTVADRQVLLMLAEDVTTAEYDAIVAQLRALGVNAIRSRQDLRMLQVGVPAAGGEAAVIAAVSASAGVAYAGYNHLVATERPNPPWTAALAARAPVRERRAAISAAGRYWADHIDLASAHAVEGALGIGAGPRVAVVDTGLAAAQSVLSESRVQRVDALGGALTDDSTADVKDHGLAVSAFALGSSADAAGVSRFSTLLMVDVYSSQCTGVLSLLGCPLGVGRVFQTDLAEGLRTAVNSDARLINVSWGDNSECGDAQARRIAARQGFRQIHAAAVNLARRKDKLIMFSAGNNCEKADDQLLPSAIDPAADSWRSNALIVGASTEARKDALFSRMGAVVNLMAPGEAVSYGQATMNGTSFATPIVTGAAAVVQGINPALSAPETRYLLTSGAEATIGFDNAAAAAYKGYTGPNARGPAQLLNVGNAAKASQLTRDAAFKSLDALSLAKGAKQTVRFDATIPDTGVRALDVVFVVDVSGSYGDDIATLKTQAGAIVDALLARGIDVQFAVTEFSDFPIGEYGSPGDSAYSRLSRISGDRTETLAAINALSLKSGADGPESQLEALYQVATGAGRDIGGDGTYDAAAGDVLPQPLGFRPGAARVVLFATDARFHDRDTEPEYPGSGFAATVAALKASGIRVIALQSGGVGSAAVDIERLVTATGGASYQLSFNSAEITAAIASGIDAALAEVEVSAEAIAGSEWIKSIEQDKTVARPGEKVTFTVEVEGQRRSSVDGLAYDLYLWVRGNGSALLQRVRIPVLVP